MDDYLFTARSITQAQRMAQALGQAGIRGGIQRLPVGLSTQGCAYGVRIETKWYEQALSLVRSMGMGPVKVFRYGPQGFAEVAL